MKALGWIGLILALVLLIAAAVIGGLWFGKQSMTATTPVASPGHTVAAPKYGTVSWEKLNPGDCVIGFANAWQDSYTVVSCDAAHSAQLLVRAAAPSAPDDFPGVKVVAKEAAKLCANPTIMDSVAAKLYSELLVEIAYPQTEIEWSRAPHFDCFVTAPTGQFLTTNLMPVTH